MRPEADDRSQDQLIGPNIVFTLPHSRVKDHLSLAILLKLIPFATFFLLRWCFATWNKFDCYITEHQSSAMRYDGIQGFPLSVGHVVHSI